jgi:hypothetical protein
VQTENVEFSRRIDNEYIREGIIRVERKAFDYLQIQFVFKAFGFAHENGEPIGVSERCPVHGEADVGES